MIRAVLAVGLAAALLAASLPAVESAATDRTRAALDRDIDRIERAGASLLAEDDPGARRIVRLSLPATSLSSAGVDAVTVDCDPDCAISYTLDDGEGRTQPLAIPGSTPDGPLRFGRTGDHRLSLTLVEREDGRPIVIRG